MKNPIKAGSDHTRWLVQQIRPFLREYLIAICCSLSGGLLATADPLLLKILLDRVLPAHSYICLAAIVAALGVSSLARLASTAYGGFAGTRVAQKVAWRLRRLIIRKLGGLPFATNRRSPQGDFFFRIERDVDQIAESGVSVILQAITFTLSTMTVMTALLWFNPQLAFASILLNVGVFYVRRTLKVKIHALSSQVQELSSESSGSLQEYLWALPQFQLLGCERKEANRVARFYSRRLRAELRWKLFETKAASFSMLAVSVATAFVMGFGGYQVINGKLTAGSLIACYGWILRMFDPLSVLVDMYSRFIRVTVSVQRVRELLEQRADVASGTLAPPSSRVQGRLRLSELNFGYDQCPDVVRNLNLLVDPGDRLALMGVSGAGKTTLGRILVRMESAAKGSAMLDGIDIQDYTLHNLRSHICYLPQEPMIVDRSIRENLLLGNPQSSDDDLWHVLRCVHLCDFVQRQPSQLETRVGPMGALLSGGERQRLVLARSLLRKPAVLVLDEATSSIDEQTEDAIIEDLLTAFPTQTMIVITHRNSCARRMHRIVRLDAGRIVEHPRRTDIVRP